MAVTGTVGGDANDGDAITLSIAPAATSTVALSAGRAIASMQGGTEPWQADTEHPCQRRGDGRPQVIRSRLKNTGGIPQCRHDGRPRRQPCRRSNPDALIRQCRENECRLLDCRRSIRMRRLQSRFTSSGGGAPVVLTGLTRMARPTSPASPTATSPLQSLSATDAAGNTTNGAPQAAAVLDRC